MLTGEGWGRGQEYRAASPSHRFTISWIRRDVAAARDDPAAFVAINETYALDMRFDSVPSLCERFGLMFPTP